jgi:hypothetical protein
VNINLKGLSFGLAIAAIAGYAPVASATTLSYSLTLDDCSGGCGSAPFGTVTVTSISSTEVSVDLTLAAGEVFATGGAGDALLFDISGDPSITITGLTSGFTATSTASGKSTHADGTGTWEYWIDCTSCGSGTSPPTNSGPLDFDVTVAGGITPASFIQNGDSLYFATDIGSGCSGSPLGSCGNTGDVAAPSITPLSPTPLPGALVLFGTVLFGGLGVSKWRKRRDRGPISALA